MIRLVLAIVFCFSVVSSYAQPPAAECASWPDPSANPPIRSGEILVAAANSPPSYQAAACFSDIQEAIDFAQSHDSGWAVTPNVVLAPGNYWIDQTIRIGYGPNGEPHHNHGCNVAGSARTWLRWSGAESQWMVQYAVKEGQANTHRAPCNLVLDGRRLAHGMLLQRYHGRPVHDLTFRNCKRGLQATNSWICDFRRLQATNCTETAIDLGNWSVGSLVGVSIHKCRGNSPLLRIRAACSEVRIVNLESSDSGDSPAVVMDGCTSCTLEGVRTERCKATAIVRAANSKALSLSGMSLWEDPGTVGVLLKDSHHCEVSRIIGYNFPAGNLVQQTGGCHHNEFVRIVED